MSLEAYLWAARLYPGAVPFSDLPVGDTFKFPASSPDVTYTKAGARSFTDAKGRRFITGRYTAVLPARRES